MGIYNETRSHNGIDYDVYLSSKGYLFVIPQMYVSDVFAEYADCLCVAERFIDLL